LTEFLRGFLPDLLGGLLVNLEIAGLALLLGLVTASALIPMRLRGGALGSAAAVLVALFWAAPTFVVMFFLANVVPDRWTLAGMTIRFTSLAVIVVSQAVFATAFITDNGLEAVRYVRIGNWGSALLFLPQLASAFFIMVTSSSQAAAIGVLDAVAVTLRAGERLPDVRHRLILFLGVVLVFVLIQRLASHLIHVCRDTLRRRFETAADP
jgi:ABC-type amino acid transport system permease subunit